MKGWPNGVEQAEFKMVYRFKPNEDRGPLPDDIEEVEAKIGACASTLPRSKVTADVHFRLMLLVLGVRYAGAPENFRTAFDASTN